MIGYVNTDKTLFYGSLRVDFPIFGNSGIFSSFLLCYVENIWCRKEQNAWHFRARVLKLDPPPNKSTCKGWGLYRKNSFCTACCCNRYKVCWYMTFKNLAFWTWSFDLQNWPYFSSGRKNSSTFAWLYFCIKQWSQYPRIFKLETGHHRPNL